MAGKKSALLVATGNAGPRDYWLLTSGNFHGFISSNRLSTSTEYCTKMASIPQSIQDYIDHNADKFIKRLAEAVSIPSISGDAAYRKYVYQMADWLEKEMTALGISTKQVPLGNHTLDGQELVLPNAILGTLGNDKNKKTVLLYGHFDVQPVSYWIRIHYAQVG